MASSLGERISNGQNLDDYTIEYYDYDYDMTDEKRDGQDEFERYNQRLKSYSFVNVQTVEHDDDDSGDEYTYEEETIEVTMGDTTFGGDDNDDMDSTAVPPPLPAYRANTTTPKASMPGASTTSASMNTAPAGKPIAVEVPASPIARASGNPVAASHFYGTESRHKTNESNFSQKEESPSVVDCLSPSQQRARSANAAGLSELSKQLRILQAKNESQSVDIHRLERQLRILADLQGISVANLRKALEDACASEAFGELQNRVAKLKHELEAATLAKKAELRKDAMAPHIANLELRVGELEEVEEKQTREIRKLYDDLREERARSMRLESEQEPLKQALKDMILKCQSETARAKKLEEGFHKQVHDMRNLQSKKMQEAGAYATKVPMEMATEYEHMVQLLKKKDEELKDARAKLHAEEIKRAKLLKDAEERARQAETVLKVEKDKFAITVKELEDADGQSGLRLAQFRARFAVQDERIVDMGQQLDSLYTGFTLLKEEIDSERGRHEAMMSNLNDADAEIARQTNKEQEKTNNVPNRDNRQGGLSHASPSFEDESVPRFINTSPGVEYGQHAVVAMAPDSPATPVTAREYASPYVHPHIGPAPRSEASEYNYADETPTTYATALPYNPSPTRTPSTWDLLLPNGRSPSGRRDRSREARAASHNDSPLRSEAMDQFERDRGDVDLSLYPMISGTLIVESNTMLRRWKPKHCKIYMRGEGYQWEVGPKRSYPLEFGVSKVEFHPNHPLSFVVYLDPSSECAPVIRAAAESEREYHSWMAALYKATSGVEYQGGQSSDNPSPLCPPSVSDCGRSSLYPTLPQASSGQVVQLGAEDQEAADLQRVLELSKHET